MQVELKRVSVIDAGAFGVLIIDGVPIAVTLEHTYTAEENPEGVVKIPKGKHLCVKTDYHKGGYKTFDVLIPGHSRILFHKGNIEKDVDGCIAVGEEFGRLNGEPAILQSGNGKGFDEFMSIVGHLESFYLTVS
jgi:hypothetical protein